jgi:hypothetical protein
MEQRLNPARIHFLNGIDEIDFILYHIYQTYWDIFIKSVI